MTSNHTVVRADIDCNGVIDAMSPSVQHRISILLQLQLNEQLFENKTISREMYLTVKQSLEKEYENE